MHEQIIGFAKFNKLVVVGPHDCGVVVPFDIVAKPLGFFAGYAPIGRRQITSISCGTGNGMAH
jgi:hypothetical protein